MLMEVCDAWGLPFLSQEFYKNVSKNVPNLKEVPRLTLRACRVNVDKSLFVHLFIKVSSDSLVAMSTWKFSPVVEGQKQC